MNPIEEEFQKLVDRYNGVDRSNRKKGVENVLRLMHDSPTKIWWWSWEFNGQTTSTGMFIGHKGSARASDLANHYPQLAESRKIGRFAVFRMRTENLFMVRDFLGLNPQGSPA